MLTIGIRFICFLEYLTVAVEMEGRASGEAFAEKSDIVLVDADNI